MSEFNPTVTLPAEAVPAAVIRQTEDDWGLRTLDLIRPPSRFWADSHVPRPAVEPGVDARRTKPVPTPGTLLASLPAGENWGSVGKRSLSRLFAHFLLAEDPQRRLDARPVNTLAHQMSLVRHILDSAHLQRVLIADEVGLGKTVEAALVIQELLTKRPGLRVLYLAPARLVSNVRSEFDRLGLGFRQWTSGDSDGRFTDPRILGSIHRAVHPRHYQSVVESGPWDVIVVDECHHLSDWAAGGGDPTDRFRLVRELLGRQQPDGRALFLSGTPHQGHPSRFDNLLGLLRVPGEGDDAVRGRVIYRTKEDVRDWEGRPLFPKRRVNEPLVIDLGSTYRAWLANIHAFFRPRPGATSEAKRRAAGWRVAQAMQWATSSPEAGLGYLVRNAIRGGWTLADPALVEAITALRPYRGGTADEPVVALYARLRAEVARQIEEDDVEDIEDFDLAVEAEDRAALTALLREGVRVLTEAGDEKWDRVFNELLAPGGDEKAVLFAQPIETVIAVARYLERRTGIRPALIIGGQSDAERARMVEAFRRPDGPRYLVSSRAGGEGINLQVARRLVHLDVPWNPMDMEQRVGRVHRFGSRRTILVDTVVVKDSRETAAYHAARQKLEMITGEMVEPERFETIFARVMCLVSPQDLGDVIARDLRLPLAPSDRDRIASLVQEGFRAWKQFDERFGGEQRRIRQLDPGLAGWGDVYALLTDYGGAAPAEGYSAMSFMAVGEDVEYAPAPAKVVKTDAERVLACGDYSGSPVYDSDGRPAEPAGLNVDPVPALLRKFAFPSGPSGPAHLRWPAGVDLPDGFPEPPWGVLVLLRQSAKMDAVAGWLEQGVGLYCYSITADGVAHPVLDDAKEQLLRGLFASAIRTKPEEASALIAAVARLEIELVRELRRPSETDSEQRIRHAVTPLFAAVVANP
jgi:superfamily II DNA or RNA helicase